MATRKQIREGPPEVLKQVEDDGDRCDICGTARYAGYWAGDKRGIKVCRTCALDELPKLISDALTERELNTPGELNHIECRILSNFRVGVICAIQRIPKMNKKRPDGD